MPFANIRGAKIRFEITGEGPNLVFINGSLGELYHWPNIMISALSSHFRVLVFDHRGLGGSSCHDEKLTMEDFADDAAELIQFVGWSKCHVVGYSFGGMVSQHLILRHEHLVETLTLMCTSAGGQGGSSFGLQSLEGLSIKEKSRSCFHNSDIRFREEAWQKSHAADYEFGMSEWIKHFTKLEADPEQIMGRKRLLEARVEHDTFSRLKTISVPVLVIACRYDGIASVESLERMHKEIKNSEFRIIEDANHGSPLAESQTYVVVLNFLAKQLKSRTNWDEFAYILLAIGMFGFWAVNM